jgi:hypothetical protein
VVRADQARFLRSLSAELRSQATRVRDLIGDRHWLTDGTHKENLVKGLLQRYVPAGIVCARGFVIGAQEELTSTEQDLLVVDAHLAAPVFQAADFIVTFPEAVLASVSVKTRLNRESITDAIKGLASVHAACDRLWTGAFFFDDETEMPKVGTLYQSIQDAIVEHQPRFRPIGATGGIVGPDLLATMKSLAFALNYDPQEPKQVRIRGFDCGEQATAVMLAHLLDHIAVRRQLPEPRLGDVLDDVTAAPLDPPEVVAVVA